MQTAPTPSPSATQQAHTGKPQIAILIPNTLSALGLSSIILRMMPGADVCAFDDFEKMSAADDGHFFHYFVTSRMLLCHAGYFLARQHKTIVLVHGDETGRLPMGFHTLNVCQSEELLVRDFLRLSQTAHSVHGAAPEAVRRAQKPTQPPTPLTARECEVLRLLVSGLINKEMADRLGVSTATVISHRKNISEKLGTRNISALTIFAVTHGIVKAEEI